MKQNGGDVSAVIVRNLRRLYDKLSLFSLSTPKHISTSDSLMRVKGGNPV